MHIIGEVKNMKFEIKVAILGIVFSFLCMLVFTYACSFTQKTMYVYQVGIYKEASNKDAKLAELKKDGIEGYSYQKENQYYVLSLITENQKEVDQQATKIKGIKKTYIVSSDTTPQILLDNLAKGITHD